jgi:hypothetical protein
MATDNSTTSAAAVAPAHSDVIHALLNLKGALHLARLAVYEEMGLNENLVSAESVLDLAEREAERLMAMIDNTDTMMAWPDPTREEVVHG